MDIKQLNFVTRVLKPEKHASLSLSLSLSIYIYFFLSLSLSLYIYIKISFPYIQFVQIQIIYVMWSRALDSGWRFMIPGPWILNPDPGSQILGPEPALILFSVSSIGEQSSRTPMCVISYPTHRSRSLMSTRRLSLTLLCLMMLTAT